MTPPLSWVLHSAHVSERFDDVNKAGQLNGIDFVQD